MFFFNYAFCGPPVANLGAPFNWGSGANPLHPPLGGPARSVPFECSFSTFTYPIIT
jgi:hypothetical protein